MRAGHNLLDQLEPSFSSGSEPMIGPLRIPTYLRPEIGPVAIESQLSEGNLDLGTDQLPGHLSVPYEVSPSSFVSPGLSVVHSNSVGEDSAIDSQQDNGTPDFSVLLDQIPSFSSPSCCDLSDNSCEKIPLFLPSQTPNRDLPPRETLSSQTPGLRNELSSRLSASPQHSRATSHCVRPHSSSICTSALQIVHANKLEQAKSPHGHQPLHATKFMIRKPPISPWLDTYQPAKLGKRDKFGSGCDTHKTKFAKASDAQGDSEPSETPVRVQGRSEGELADRLISSRYRSEQSVPLRQRGALRLSTCRSIRLPQVLP